MTGIMIVLRTSHLTLPTHSTCWQIAVPGVKFFLTGDEKEDIEDESSSDSEVSDWPLVWPSDKCMCQIHSSAGFNLRGSRRIICYVGFFPKCQLPKCQLPERQLPKSQLPEYQLPKMSTPKMSTPKIYILTKYTIIIFKLFHNLSDCSTNRKFSSSFNTVWYTWNGIMRK